MQRVSVIVPTYNRADLLRLTLQSILGQTLPAHEVIVVDDGSTDHTAQVCAEFGNSILYLHQKNHGLPAARNAGIRRASGDWVAFCDSDDLWRPRKLELQLTALQATKAGWSLTGFGIIDADGNQQRGQHEFSSAFPLFADGGITPARHFGRWLHSLEISLGDESVLVYEGDAYGMLFEGNVALPSTSIVARKIIDQAGPFDTTFRAEETEFFHRISAYARVAIVIDRLADYRVGHPSLIKGDAAPFVRDAIRSLNQASQLRATLTAAERTAFREGRRRLRLRLAYTQLSALDRAGARRTLYEGWPEDGVLSPQSTAIMLASLLPERALTSLHWAKRVIKDRLA